MIDYQNMNKKYDNYKIGKARLGYYVVCLNFDPSGEATDYLHTDGVIRPFAGEDSGYFNTRMEAEYAILFLQGDSPQHFMEHLPADLFEI